MARILIAVDGSPPSLRALEFGVSLAARLGVGVVLLHVMPRVVLPLGAGGPEALARLQLALQAEGTQLLESLSDRARPYPVALEKELGVGDPALTLYERSQAPDIQMVVMGSRGQGAVARLLLGSVATKMVHTSNKPVVVVR